MYMFCHYSQCVRHTRGNKEGLINFHIFGQRTCVRKGDNVGSTKPIESDPATNVTKVTRIPGIRISLVNSPNWMSCKSAEEIVN